MHFTQTYIIHSKGIHTSKCFQNLCSVQSLIKNHWNRFILSIDDSIHTKILKNCYKKGNILGKTQKREYISLKMTQIFVSIQSAFEIIHMSRPQSFENFNRFNLKRLLILAILSMFLGCACMCFIPAETFVEYSASIYTVSSTIVIILLAVTLFWHIPNIFALIADFRSGIEMRKFEFGFFFFLEEFESLKCLNDFINMKQVDKIQIQMLFMKNQMNQLRNIVHWLERHSLQLRFMAAWQLIWRWHCSFILQLD